MRFMKKRLDPAKTVVETMGGPSKVAQMLGVHRTAVFWWMQPKNEGGTGGFIPAWHQPTLLDLAEQKGLHLTAEMIIRGRKARKD